MSNVPPSRSLLLDLANTLAAASTAWLPTGKFCQFVIPEKRVDEYIAALRSDSSETNAQDAKDAARYRWLISGVSLGKADSLKQSWLRLRGYLHDAQPDPERGWSAGKESFDNLVDGQRNDQPAD